MAAIPSLASDVRSRVALAIDAAYPAVAGTDPALRRSERADFQANGALGLGAPLRAAPREIAGRILAELRPDALVARWELSGPGFLNVTLADAAIIDRIAARAADTRLGVGRPGAAGAGPTVIDYSQPNVAKEMHVGHLRSTVIGDALARVLGHLGETVVRRNHIGDWGTQFGMIVQYLLESGSEPEPAVQPKGPAAEGGSGGEARAISRLDRVYRAARARFDGDPAFADRSRGRLVALQAGDPETVAVWRSMVDESTQYFQAVYARLDVLLREADAVGESHYNDRLADLCAELERSGVAVRSNGALCVFFDDITGPDGEPAPLIVRKSDGGYGYATTDLAAIRDRVDGLGATRLLYVVDRRQALHFRMVFETARRAGWLPDQVQAEHLPFGTVLGRDGRPFRTRAGDTVRLTDLLDEAVERASAVVADKSPQLDQDELALRARQLGIGAVKYADLSTSRTRDYVFDLERMVSLNGDTSVYLQYANARIRSILRKAPEDVQPIAHRELALQPAERALALLLDGFGDALASVQESCEPHRLCGYLSELASAFAGFYEHCPVLKAPDRRIQENRLLLCRLTGLTLEQGLQLLGVAAPDRL
jgi:arginyl-tRNA synthetase